MKANIGSQPTTKSIEKPSLAKCGRGRTLYVPRVMRKDCEREQDSGGRYRRDAMEEVEQDERCNHLLSVFSFPFFSSFLGDEKTPLRDPKIEVLFLRILFALIVLSGDPGSEGDEPPLTVPKTDPRFLRALLKREVLLAGLDGDVECSEENRCLPFF